MVQEKVKEKNGFRYGWIVIIIIVIIGWFYLNNLSEKDITFVIKPDSRWIYCWKETSNLIVTYEVASSSAIDILFMPSKNDAYNLTKTSLHYETCYLPNILKTDGACRISGEGCMVFLNKYEKETTITLTYSAKRAD